MDEDGYIYIVDRKKEMTLRRGYNVYPREIEEILYTHLDVGWPQWRAYSLRKEARAPALRGKQGLPAAGRPC
jgi:acyl-CoA synthetase (AMP-forming)/AMP-acid ligase II